MSKPKILLAAYGGGHVNIIIPIYWELVQRGYETVVLGLTMAQHKLANADIPYISFLDFLTEDDKKAIELGSILVEGMELNPFVPLNETVAYMGICYNELINLHGVEKAKLIYESKGRQSFLPREFIGRVLRKVKPGVVITTNSPRTEKALVLESRALDIPCVVVCDFYGVAAAKDRLGKKSYGNKVFVPFNKMKSILVSMQRSESEIGVIGNPALDCLAKLNTHEMEHEIRLTNEWKEKKIILWVKSVFPPILRTEQEVEELLIQNFKNDSSVQLVFRVHPNDPKDYNYLAGAGVAVSTESDSLYEILSCADLVLTVNSTVGLEANLIGKEVVQIAPDDFPEKIPFFELGIGHSFTCLKQLSLYIDETLQNRHSHHKQKPCFITGTATLSVVNYIEIEYSTN